MLLSSDFNFTKFFWFGESVILSIYIINIKKTHTHTHTHTRTHACTHARILARIQVCAHAR